MLLDQRDHFRPDRTRIWGIDERRKPCRIAILVVDSALKAVGLVAILVFGSWLFWKLIRAMARLQMPSR